SRPRSCPDVPSREPPAVASPVDPSPPAPRCHCALDWSVTLTFAADASPEALPFDWSIEPASQVFATQIGTATLTDSACTAFDTADASFDVLLVFDADCDWSTSPPELSPLVASPEPQQPAPSVVASPVHAFPPTPVWLWSLDCDVAFPSDEDAFPAVLIVCWLVPVRVCARAPVTPARTAA